MLRLILCPKLWPWCLSHLRAIKDNQIYIIGVSRMALISPEQHQKESVEGLFSALLCEAQETG